MINTLKPIQLWMALLCFYTSVTAQTAHKMELLPVGLRCDLMLHPDYQSTHGYAHQPQWQKAAFERTTSVKINHVMPIFSWELQSSASDVEQHAYQILLSDNLDSLSENKGTWWNSGKVNAAKSTAVVYEGQALKPQTLYYWKVRVWDNRAHESAYSKPQAFYTSEKLVDNETARYPLEKTDEYPQTILKKEGLICADFGQAAFGQLRLTLSSDVEGDTVWVHMGEAIEKNGRINRKPGGTIRYQVYPLALRPGTHTYQILLKRDKRNTGPTAVLMPDYIGEVLPFRYVEVEHYSKSLVKEDMVRTAVNYPFNDEAATFESSDTILNKIWDLCKHTIKATTFAGVYVDGDRERIPYEADAYINQLCHYAMDNEYSLARYSHEYLIRHATWPTEWILQSVLMAMNDYMYTGDLRSAKEYYKDLQAKTLVALEDANGLISTRTGKQNPNFLQSIHYHGDALKDIVDWPHSGILGLGKEDVGETDGFVFTDYNAVVNAYYYKALCSMADLSEALGYTADAAHYRGKAKKVYQIFQQEFFDKKKGVYRDGIGTDHASLHSNMFALAFHLVPEKQQLAVLEFVRSRGLACSVYGAQFLMDAIYNAGDGAYGLDLLTSTANRSWYNMIREGSTMTMEAWGNQYKPNQDWNHVWGAVPGNIIPRKLMGVEPLSPGWATFQIKPQLGDLTWANIQVPTIKGTITVHCKKDEKQFALAAEIPANTKADIWIPTKKLKGKMMMWINDEERQVVAANGWIKLAAIGSGKHRFQIDY